MKKIRSEKDLAVNFSGYLSRMLCRMGLEAPPEDEAPRQNAADRETIKRREEPVPEPFPVPSFTMRPPGR